MEETRQLFDDLKYDIDVLKKEIGYYPSAPYDSNKTDTLELLTVEYEKRLYKFNKMLNRPITLSNKEIIIRNISKQPENNRLVNILQNL